MSGVFFYWLTRGHKIRGRKGGAPIGPSLAQSSPESAGPGHAQPLAEVAPGYIVNEATEDADQLTAAPIPSQGGIDAPGVGQASSSTNLGKHCACIVCLSVGIYDSSNYGPEHCHFVNCNWTSYWPGSEYEGRYRAAHARTHYRQGQGPKKYQIFHCPVEDCRYSAKRWSDLRRHTTATHCNNPATFECSVMGCKYHGEGNGFTRKDKLTAHCRSMHNGQRVPGQAVRTLQPAPASSYAEASGSGSIAGQQQ